MAAEKVSLSRSKLHSTRFTPKPLTSSAWQISSEKCHERASYGIRPQSTRRRPGSSAS
jgi:hypothetical protein